MIVVFSFRGISVRSVQLLNVFTGVLSRSFETSKIPAPRMEGILNVFEMEGWVEPYSIQIGVGRPTCKDLGVERLDF